MRALAKIMDFLRAVSILLVVMHLYWYCYGAILAWEVNIGVVDRILMNFLHETFCARAAGTLLSGDKGSEEREDDMDKDLDGPRSRNCPVLLELVDIGAAFAGSSKHSPLYGCCRHRICVPADGGDLDEPC